MDDIFSYINKVNEVLEAINLPELQAVQEQYAAIQNDADVLAARQAVAALSSLGLFTNRLYQEEQPIISNITRSLSPILDGYTILDLHPKSRKQEQKEKAGQISEKVISEIYLPDEKKIITNDSPIITIMPANDKVFSYLAKHPEELYNCTPREFEEFMAELYRKLGYKAELTKATRDGGKDIILRKPDILGDMVYYVECKQHNVKNKVGIDIVQRFTGVIEMDKVNGGIIATTSFFSSDAENWIMEKDLNYRIQMHDFNKIKNMLKVTT